jgi:hypothetical protein
LLLHRFFLQLHFVFFPLCFFLPAKTYFWQFRHSKQLQASVHTFPNRKHRQYSFRHPLFEQLQNVSYATLLFFSKFFIEFCFSCLLLDSGFERILFGERNYNCWSWSEKVGATEFIKLVEA